MFFGEVMKIKFLTMILFFLTGFFMVSCSDTPSSTNAQDLLKKEEVFAEQCQDGKDNDEDGKIDCEDSGCKGYVFCQVIVKTENTAVDCNDTKDNDDGKLIAMMRIVKVLLFVSL